ncbi:uncharacterized protein TRAVEDRAFT_20790 [Trametes versicolor FP-101664 SS1]|uniref:uncharacterized protein n=1 Tax=Trametes versicolor (strain FP-101664) TaxID=717944 RepID=UPI0004622709|nr:uncharacterized protein TRAVEDRAFT_20790 [Trametes versicolor FP-101664 SS1]EIW58967.1 hypothetical protein TRAVEDRAFT_20790 [Trametes versicolor FP-101664 SS1]
MAYTEARITLEVDVWTSSDQAKCEYGLMLTVYGYESSEAPFSSTNVQAAAQFNLPMFDFGYIVVRLCDQWLKLVRETLLAKDLVSEEQAGLLLDLFLSYRAIAARVPGVDDDLLPELLHELILGAIPMTRGDSADEVLAAAVLRMHDLLPAGEVAARAAVKAEVEAADEDKPARAIVEAARAVVEAARAVVEAEMVEAADEVGMANELGMAKEARVTDEVQEAYDRGTADEAGVTITADASTGLTAVPRSGIDVGEACGEESGVGVGSNRCEVPGLAGAFLLVLVLSDRVALRDGPGSAVLAWNGLGLVEDGSGTSVDENMARRGLGVGVAPGVSARAATARAAA